MALRRARRRPSTRDSAEVLIVGLGNPGPEYDGTRHNVGFAVVDLLAERNSASWRSTRQRALVADVRMQVGDDPVRVLLAKPQTFMNASGESVKALAREYDIDLSRVCVVHDELDLDLGVLRIKQGGGSAGHKGIGSIAAVCGSTNFVRVRFGIGRPPGRMPGADWVLKAFRRDEADEVAVAVHEAADMVTFWLRSGVEETQNRFHGTER